MWGASACAGSVPEMLIPLFCSAALTTGSTPLGSPLSDQGVACIRMLVHAALDREHSLHTALGVDGCQSPHDEVEEQESDEQGPDLWS
jgi:hypothetical protein